MSIAATTRTIHDTGLAAIARDATEIDEMYATDLAVIAGISTLRKTLEELERRAVAAAVGRGASWAEIGTAVGVSRQAAHERFSR